MELPIILSIISLIIAITTFFLANLQPAKLVSKSGPSIKVYYADYESGESFGLYLPTTFINKASLTGTVLNAAITINRKDAPEQLYFFQWKEFSKLDVDANKWVYEEMAHAVALPGKSTISKIIWFMWESDSQPKIILREGAYILSFYFWDKQNKSPRCESHEFLISESIFKKLDSNRAQKKSGVVDIRLDLEISNNRLMTPHEIKKLLA